MDKFSVADTGSFLKLLIAETAPCLAKTNAELKRAWCQTHGLDLPEAPIVLRNHKLELALHVEFFLDLTYEVFPRRPLIHEHEFSALMELFSRIEGRSHDIVSRHVDENYATKDPEEFLLSNLHCFLKLYVLSLGWGSVPFRIEAGDS